MWFSEFSLPQKSPWQLIACASVHVCPLYEEKQKSNLSINVKWDKIFPLKQWLNNNSNILDCLNKIQISLLVVHNLKADCSVNVHTWTFTWKDWQDDLISPMKSIISPNISWVMSLLQETTAVCANHAYKSITEALHTLNAPIN